MKLRVRAIKAAITKLYNEPSVSPIEIFLGLKDIREYVDTLLGSVAGDLELEVDD